MNKFPIVGVGALVVHENQILLVKRAKPPYQDLWTIPGGKVHWGETLQQAVERELLEETGVHVRAGEVIYAFDIIEGTSDYGVTQENYHYVVIDLVADYISGEAVAGDDAAQVEWFRLDDILQESRTDVRQTIQETTLVLIKRWAQQSFYT